MENTSGLALARELYAASLPVLREHIPDLLDRAAFGLVGEGSECFGCDDAVSRDHDWGPAFCMWLDEQDCQRHGARVSEALSRLPRTFHGFSSRMSPEAWGGRVGMLSIEAFYGRFLGRAVVPASWNEWRNIPEKFLAVCTNGEVFADPSGRFSSLREKLLDYYPEDWRRKKIAARCMDMAQTGQYNLLRARKRGDALSAMLTRARFAEAALAMVYLLNRRYMPFYKWAGALARPLPVLGQACVDTLNALAAPACQHEEEHIEAFCALVAHRLRAEGLSSSADSWLWLHGPEVQSGIRDRQLRELPPQWD